MIHNGQHLKVYDLYFNVLPHERRCELTGRIRPDITHIDASGMGGRQSAHVIENLMALDRVAHIYFGDKTEFKDWLREIHLAYMENMVPYYMVRPTDPVFMEFINKCYNSVRFLR